MKRVLFVCVENSCRSQMAEALARRRAKEAVEVWSAGSKPSGKVNETALALLKESGADTLPLRSKGLNDLPAGEWDAVVTMGCGDACPHLPAKRRLDWALPDPKHLPLDEFRRVRNQIEGLVTELLHDLSAET